MVILERVSFIGRKSIPFFCLIAMVQDVFLSRNYQHVVADPVPAGISVMGLVHM